MPIHEGEARQPEDIGELFGVYEAIKHAEANGEALDHGDIEVMYEGLTHILRRGRSTARLRAPTSLAARRVQS